jgi:hypothetical protein
MAAFQDYLDNDVARVLSEHVTERRNYNSVIKELKGLIKMNRYAEYLKTFDCPEGQLQERLEIAHRLITDKRKTRWLTNWPTKQPSFYTNYRNRDTLRNIKGKNNEECVIDGLGWRLKRFPKKQNYPLETISLLHKKNYLTSLH